MLGRVQRLRVDSKILEAREGCACFMENFNACVMVKFEGLRELILRDALEGLAFVDM